MTDNHSQRAPFGPPVPHADPQPEPVYVLNSELAAQMDAYEQQLAADITATTMSDGEILVQSVLDHGVAELISAATPDADIATLVAAAELGHGGQIRGLSEALVSIRDGERAELVAALMDLAGGVPMTSLITAVEAGAGRTIEGLSHAAEEQWAAVRSRLYGATDPAA